MTVKVVVPLSGGEDSQASLKLACEHFAASEIRGLFCDTQFEHPKTYAHIEKLRTLYGDIQIDTVSEGDVLGKCRKYKRFPGAGARHCTDELKIQPTKKYLKALAETLGHGFEVWYGMRLSESNDRKRRYSNKVCDALYPPHEVMPGKYPKYLHKLGISFRLCILDWSDEETRRYLEGHHNPLYDDGFPRVGCFPCLAGGDAPKEKAFAYDDFGRSQRIKVVQLGHEIKKNPFTSKGGCARNPDAVPSDIDAPPCAVCSI